MADKKDKKAKRSLKNTFKDSIKYIKENKFYIYFIILLFFINAVIAFVLPENFSFFNELLKNLKDKTEGLGLLELIIFILRNNISTSFLGLFLGIFLGIFPVLTAIFNGLIIGYVFNLASDVGGYGVAWMLVPHGIFELPAVFISLGLGLSLGWLFVARFFTYYWKNRNFILLLLGIIFPVIAVFAAFLLDKKLSKGYGKEFNRRFTNSIKTFLTVIIPLLIIAAAIEGLLIVY